MLKVYKQCEPIATGERSNTGQPIYRANLVVVGVVETWADAKQLCAVPIVEVVGKPH